MGIQINGNTDNISAVDGDLSITGITTFSQLDVGSNIKLGNAGVVTATSFVGSGANLTGITQTTINSNTNNYLITGTGTANTLQGEANLTFDGNDLSVTGTAPAINFIDTDADDYKIHNVQGLLKVTDTTASADRFVINDNGTGYFLSNFQIGSTTTSPGATLHIKTSYPSLKVDSGGHASDAYVRIISGNAENSRVDFGDTDDDNIGVIDYDHANNSMSFTTNTSEKLRITSGGQIRLPVNGQQLTWGASQQMKFYYENSEDRMYLQGDGAYGFAFRVNGGNSLEISKTTGDVVMQGASGRNFQWDNSEASLYLTDSGSSSARLKVGTGGDLQLYHDAGSNVNFITAATNGEIKSSANKHTFYDYTGVTKRMEIASSGYVGINRASPAEYLDVDGGARFRSYVYIGDGFYFKSNAFGGNTNLDTGISINQGGRGGCGLLLVSRNYNNGTGTSAGIYRIKWYYDGNNAPATHHMSGDNFISFGVSGSNTLTINGGGGNQLYGIINVTA